MKRTLFLLTTICALSASLCLRAQLPAAYAARLQSTLDSLCRRHHIKGASAAVYVPGSGVWTGVHGESHTGMPISSGMAFPLNSNTKTYLAALMLRLQEQGALQLSDTIGKWIRNVPNVNGQVTIRQLLNHTSGIYSYTNNPDLSDSLESDLSRVWQPQELLRFINRPVFAPGGGWDYSNTNYLLAGMIASQVTGMPVEQAIRTKLLAPAGLSKTWYFPQELPLATVPHFWFDTGSGLIDATDLGYTPESFYSAAGSSGALFGTAEDNLLFWRKLVGGQIVNAASLAEWRQTVYLNSTTGYGLGMFRYRNFNERVVYTHGGTAPGAINENLADSASGVCITVLTNQDSASNTILRNEVVKALHRVTIDVPTAIAGTQAPMPFSIYPNPARGVLYIARNPATAQPCNYLIRDAGGKIVLSGMIGKTETSIRVEPLTNGVYYLQLREAAGITGGASFVINR